MAKLLGRAVEGLVKATSLRSELLGELKSFLSLLEEFGLPKGILPLNFSRFEFERDVHKGFLIVHMPEPLEITFLDHSVIRYDKIVTGNLGAGNFSDIKGMKIQSYFGIWVPITSIYIEESALDKVYLQCIIRIGVDSEVFEKQREGVELDKY